MTKAPYHGMSRKKMRNSSEAFIALNAIEKSEKGGLDWQSTEPNMELEKIPKNVYSMWYRLLV